jgi:(p)ppGpp synthase/HD superfamily hydrolase
MANTPRANDLWLNSVVTAKARSCIRNISKRQTEQGSCEVEIAQDVVSEKRIVRIAVDVLVEHQGTLAEITVAISSLNSNISDIQSQKKEDGIAQLQLAISTENAAHLANILEQLNHLNGVVQAVEII